MSIQMFIDLLLNPLAIISRLPEDVQRAITKRGTLNKWVQDGTLKKNLGHNYPARRKSQPKPERVPKALAAMKWALQEIPADQLTLKNIANKTGYSNEYVVENMRRMGYRGSYSNNPSEKLFTIGQMEGRVDKYDEVYKFYCEQLPSLKMPLLRIKLLAITREHKMIGPSQNHRDVCSKAVRNLAKEGKITLSTDKKSIVSVEGLING